MKEFWQQLLRKTGKTLSLITELFFRVLPWSFNSFFAKILAFLWFDLFRIRRKVIDDNLDIEHNEFDRSILLHELVHHAQTVMGKYEDLSLCESWKSSEIEAYRIQDMYLARVASAKRIPRMLTQALRCP